MSVTGVSITMSTAYRGVAQEFSNTFYYNTPLPVVAATADSLIDALVAKLKPMHAPTVNFVRGRAWSAGGTEAANQMLAQKNLTGAGTNASAESPAMDKERAFLVRIRAGVDSKGRPVYLRKWFHLLISTVGGSAISNTQLQNTATLTSAQRAQLVTWMDDFKSVTAGVQVFTLISRNGREITGDTICHPYLEHHQLGDMWR